MRLLERLSSIYNKHSLIAEGDIRLRAVGDDNVGVAVDRERADLYSRPKVAYIVDMDMRVDSVGNKEIVSDNGRLTGGRDTAYFGAALLSEVVRVDRLRALYLKRVIYAAVGEGGNAVIHTHTAREVTRGGSTRGEEDGRVKSCACRTEVKPKFVAHVVPEADVSVVDHGAEIVVIHSTAGRVGVKYAFTG